MMNNIEHTVTSEASYSDMDTMVDNAGFTKSAETTFGSTNGWMVHRNESDICGFTTIGGAKRSTRKFWNEDKNQYFVVYEDFAGYVTVYVAQITSK